MGIIRVFPRRTSHTPRDEYAFIGEPPLWRPVAQTVWVSVCFTWDIAEGRRLQKAWAQHYTDVRLGGPAFGSPVNGFEAGVFVKQGVVFTSRGCGRSCSYCLVPQREGPLLELAHFPNGHIIQDNSFLQTSSSHRQQVYQMLSEQRIHPKTGRRSYVQPAAIFSGGIQASLVTNEIADELRGIRIEELFLAADTDGALKPLEKAIHHLSFLPRRKLRCYVLCGFNGETIERARARLERVWELGALPFAQLYRPSEGQVEYSEEWRKLQREWSRPAAMFSTHKPCVP